MTNKLLIQMTIPVASLLLSLLLPSCKKDSTTGQTGMASVEITDGPSDDVNVKAVFVTVADVKIDGKSWSGFQGKTTFDLAAYQKGQTKILGNGALDAKSYSQIVLVLDTETDASGNAPGCYVQDAGNVKHKLEGSASKEIAVAGNFTAAAATTNNLVLDFDLRKALTYKSGSNTDYAFVTDAELSAAIRLEEKTATSTIKGTCNDAISASDKIVVYAYKKGSYDVSVEKQGQGTSQIQFKNAVSSATVAQDGSFQVSFLEKGNYELHFISYKNTGSDGKLEAKGELQLTLTGSLDLLNLALDTTTNVNLNLLVTGVVHF